MVLARATTVFFSLQTGCKTIPKIWEEGETNGSFFSLLEIAFFFILGRAICNTQWPPVSQSLDVSTFTFRIFFSTLQFWRDSWAFFTARAFFSKENRRERLTEVYHYRLKDINKTFRMARARNYPPFYNCKCTFWFSSLYIYPIWIVSLHVDNWLRSCTW